MSDKLVFDLATESEGVPNVFVRKDWINILDNQNQNYNNNQSVIDTSQLSNSNKYMNYREAYVEVPMLLTLAAKQAPTAGAAVFNIGGANNFTTPAMDYVIGLKNWFGSIIHSFTLDYNGTTIIQQTPFINMWNSFKLMTSLSYQDIMTQGSVIGFYPDTADSWSYTPAAAVPGTGTLAGGAPSGIGVCNNTDTLASPIISLGNIGKCGFGNEGFTMRKRWICFNPLVDVDTSTQATTISAGLLGGQGSQICNNVWKSYISSRVDQGAGTTGYLQISILATIYLKHIHSFFNMVPLLKGAFMKMTMNLNNCTAIMNAYANAAGAGALTCLNNVDILSVSNAVGGVCPFMVSSGTLVAPFNYPGSNNVQLVEGGTQLISTITTTTNTGAAVVSSTLIYANISVGASILDQSIASLLPVGAVGALAKSVYLYVPAYTFNPVFEQAYLSSPIKTIRYSDVYQYQVQNVASGQPFNNLITNGIANIKSVLVLPFYSYSGKSTGMEVPSGGGLASAKCPVYQSPFDPAGTGPTSPLCYINNFNVQVSGQNAIYNMERYNFEQFNNQLYGQNAVNGGLTDGLTSSLIDRYAFDQIYCYYYVNVERMLPVERSVPKSIQILGQNQSGHAIDLMVFVEYENEVQVDILTGARV